MERVFIIPMVGPASGKGTRTDPWRPKYLREAGISFASLGNMRDRMLCRVWGDESAVDAMSKNADVVEIDVGNSDLIRQLHLNIADSQRKETRADREAALALLRQK